jgi:predicted O-methyltransferase YrrM
VNEHRTLAPSARAEASEYAASESDQFVEAARTALATALTNAAGVDLSRIRPPPIRGPWSLWPDALQFLVSLVAALQPQHVLEFGSGLSTRVLAWACAESSPECGITSIDNDPDFSFGAAQALAGQELKSPVQFQVVPLAIRNCGGHDLPVYLLDHGAFASPLPPDLVVIDGPPEPLGGREGTLYQVLTLARPGTLVVLDDAARPHESAILARWRTGLGDAIELSLLTELTGGMAAIIVRRPIAGEELWLHRARVALRQIASIVPPGATFVLVENAAWGIEFCSRELGGGRHLIPFLERDGQYWGPPADDATAIGELERLRGAGAEFAIFAAPALWWLDYYAGLKRHLRSHFHSLRSDELLVAFDLRSDP